LFVFIKPRGVTDKYVRFSLLPEEYLLLHTVYSSVELASSRSMRSAKLSSTIFCYDK